ncbi:T9SS type A sorting domain-containing protein [Runella slithyformis]|uniref:T9SS type A sorting domain-containing protein n=1 Tax=Runella slithyformis TaxID=106 RepID=UPI00146DACF6|nr:T9SS type A sorting domain-containing protein [Runella slithyformis]
MSHITTKKRWLRRAFPETARIICVLFLLCQKLTEAYSTTYYVATNGNDSNAGTKDLPFASIGKGASIAKAGDVVIIKSGTYKPTTRIQPANSGTQNAPITFMAEVNNEVIIDGSNAASPTATDRLGLFTILGTTTVTQNWIVVDGIRIISSAFAGFHARYATNITIKNCSTFNTGASGIVAANSSSIKVLNNKVQKACQAASASLGTNECITIASVAQFEVAYNSVSDRTVDLNNGGEGIDAKNECKDGSIHHNTVFDLVRQGIYVDAYQRNINNIDVYANRVYKCGAGIGVAIEEGGTLTGVKIHDNIVFDIPRAGIQVRGYLVNGPMKDVFVYQNTVVRTGNLQGITYENAGILIDADHPNNSNMVVRNNIVAECAIQIKTKTFSFLTVDNNLLFGTSSTPKPTNPSVLYGNPGTNAILENPLFENTANADFRLKANSPAIDKAVGTPLSTMDCNDFSRPAQGDLGAVEYQKIEIVLSAENPQEKNKDLILYPNPSKGIVTMSLYAEAGKTFLIDVLDSQGRTVQNTNYVSSNTGQNVVNLPTERLENGTYIIHIISKDGDRISKKLMVQQ